MKRRAHLLLVCLAIAGCRSAPPPAPSNPTPAPPPSAATASKPPFDASKGLWHKESGTGFLYPKGWKVHESRVEDDMTILEVEKKGFFVTLFWTPQERFISAEHLAQEEYAELQPMYQEALGRPKAMKIAGQDGYVIPISTGPGGDNSTFTAGELYAFVRTKGVREWQMKLRASVKDRKLLPEVDKLLANYRCD